MTGPRLESSSAQLIVPNAPYSTLARGRAGGGDLNEESGCLSLQRPAKLWCIESREYFAVGPDLSSSSASAGRVDPSSESLNNSSQARSLEREGVNGLCLGPSRHRPEAASAKECDVYAYVFRRSTVIVVQLRTAQRRCDVQNPLAPGASHSL